VRRTSRWLVWWGLLAALWLLLVDNTKLPELVAGAVAAALGATAAAAIEERHPVRLAPRPGWLLGGLRVLPRLPLDCLVLAVALVRRRPGSFRAIRFRGGGDDPESVARRAFAEVLDSLGPNSYVVGIDEDVMLVHQLEPPEDAASVDPAGLR
jgi:hypothetical protein